MTIEPLAVAAVFGRPVVHGGKRAGNRKFDSTFTFLLKYLVGVLILKRFGIRHLPRPPLGVGAFSLAFTKRALKSQNLSEKIQGY